MQWEQYTRDEQFNEDEIEQALLVVNQTLGDIDSPQRSHDLYLRGLWHEEGIGGDTKYDEAIRLFNEAIELGNANAMNARGYMHLYGLGGEVDYLNAIKLLEKAIWLGNASAMNNRGYMHIEGLGDRSNYPAAIKLLEKAIGLGNASAMTNRGYMYEVGLGGERNYDEAIKLYDEAIELGSSFAIYNRIHMHEQGLGGDVNYPQIVCLYKKLPESRKSRIDIFRIMLADLKSDELNKLCAKIDEMIQYGSDLEHDKAFKVLAHAYDLKDKLELFLLNSYEKKPSHEEVSMFKEEFTQLLHSKDKEMEAHREAWKPIIVNILIAFTGIGFVALLAKVAAHAIASYSNKTNFSLNRACFFAKTHSQTLIEEIEQANDWTIIAGSGSSI
ncbi:tetratricopeptide repeat protein [Legionella cardiaca]|uniref:Tetratricopeptide repeat protein n=1 Tax=Legionella cardiaca TaxID=1071983 RepID=A0ABY8ARN9_9GAMM|nr:tetratricopeptide repeat protein [Legionella cardiaca]WED42190.1 tetratricopeptide repeat protein [Legionella cardiaca]